MAQRLKNAGLDRCAPCAGFCAEFEDLFERQARAAPLPFCICIRDASSVRGCQGHDHAHVESTSMLGGSVNLARAPTGHGHAADQLRRTSKQALRARGGARP